MKRKGWKKRFLRPAALAMAFIMALSFCVFADNYEDDRDKLDDLHQQADNAEDQIRKNNAQVAELTNKITQLEESISKASGEIEVLKVQLSETENKISEAILQLNELEGKINTQNVSLSERLRAMYKSGDIGLLSVLLGSSSMSEFITNLNMVQRIYKADADLITRLDNQYQEVMTRKTELADLQETLKQQQAELNEKKTALDKDVKETANLRSQVQKDTAAFEKLLDDLKKEADELKEIIRQKQMSGAYTGGRMCWPSAASSYITSPFGYRIHPIYGSYKFHTGIDIGAYGGSNILAANSGRVMTVVYNYGTTGYGCYVMIDHGGGIVTLYAHCSAILVQQGQYVDRGQVIARVGTTGASTGYHLHFEVRVDGQYQEPLQYVTQGQYYYD